MTTELFNDSLWWKRHGVFQPHEVHSAISRNNALMDLYLPRVGLHTQSEPHKNGHYHHLYFQDYFVISLDTYTQEIENRVIMVQSIYLEGNPAPSECIRYMSGLLTSVNINHCTGFKEADYSSHQKVVLLVPFMTTETSFEHYLQLSWGKPQRSTFTSGEWTIEKSSFEDVQAILALSMFPDKPQQLRW